MSEDWQARWTEGRIGWHEADGNTALKEYWQRDDRYQASLEVVLAGKPITLLPLPHPSPLNAVWYPKFPALLRARLVAYPQRTK